MTSTDHKLNLTRQSSILGISQGSVYYTPRAVSDADLKLMRRIDELHLDFPFAPFRRSCGSSVGQWAAACRGTCCARRGIGLASSTSPR